MKTMPSWRRALALFILGIPASGCSTFIGASGGPSWDTGTGVPAAAFAAHAGLGYSDQGALNSGYASADLRFKVGPQLTQAALGLGGFMTSSLPGDRLLLYTRPGFHLLQFDSFESETYFGMFSPYLEIGGGVVLYETGYAENMLLVTDTRRTRLFLTLGGSIEYDIRFGGPDSGYGGLIVGLGLSDESMDVSF